MKTNIRLLRIAIIPKKRILNRTIFSQASSCHSKWFPMCILKKIGNGSRYYLQNWLFINKAKFFHVSIFFPFIASFFFLPDQKTTHLKIFRFITCQNPPFYEIDFVQIKSWNDLNINMCEIQQHSWKFSIVQGGLD